MEQDGNLREAYGETEKPKGTPCDPPRIGRAAGYEREPYQPEDELVCTLDPEAL